MGRKAGMLLLLPPLLGGCAVMEDVGEATLDVAVFAVEGTGRLLEAAVVATVDLAGTAVDAVVRQSGSTARTAARQAVDTTAGTARHAAHQGVELVEDSDARQVLSLALPDGRRFLRIVELGTTTGAGKRRLESVRFEGRDAAGRPIGVPDEVRRRLDRGGE